MGFSDFYHKFATPAACVCYSWVFLLPSLILTRPLVPLRMIVREGQKARLLSGGSLVNLQSELYFQRLLSSYISPSSPCISLFSETYLPASPSTNYPQHMKRIRLFSLIFSPRLHYAGLPGRTRGKKGGGGAVREQHAAWCECAFPTEFFVGIVVLKQCWIY